MGETDEELRARIEARINARRDEMRTGPGDEPGEVETAPTPGDRGPEPENPMAGEQILEPSRAWGAPAESGSATESPSGNPWLTGTAPSVREAQQRAAELAPDERPIGTAAGLRPRRPWVKESDDDGQAATARPEVHRRPVSFVPAEEPAEFPHREAQTRRERRQQRRAEKSQQKATDRVSKETPDVSPDVPPVYQEPIDSRHVTGSGEPDRSGAWTTPTYGLPQTPVVVPIPETPMSAPPPNPFPAPDPRYAAEGSTMAEPSVQYGPPPEAMHAPEPVFEPEPEVEPPSRFEITQEPVIPAAESYAAPAYEFTPPPSWGPPVVEGSGEVSIDEPVEPVAVEESEPEAMRTEAPASMFPAFELPVAPSPPTDFRAELAALRAQIAELAQELSAAPIPPAQPNQPADSGGLFRRNRAGEQGPDETS